MQMICYGYCIEILFKYREYLSLHFLILSVLGSRAVHLNKLCGRPPQNAPAPVTLTFDLLTLKVVS